MYRFLLLFLIAGMIGCGSDAKVSGPKEPVNPPDYTKEPLPKGETSPGPP